MGGQAVVAEKRGQVFFVKPDRVTIIGLDTPHKEGEHPLWDERVGLQVDENLGRNIAVRGNIDAVHVRKNGKHPEGHPYAGQDVLEVVAGRQRTRACRWAYAEAVRAGEVPPLLKIEVERGTVEDHLGLMVAENEHRRSDGPAVRAKKAGRMVQMGVPLPLVANAFGVTQQTIEEWLRFNELSLTVRKSVDVGKVSYSTAVQLHGLSHEEQDTKLADLIASGNTTARAAKAVRKGKTATAAQKARLLTPATCRLLLADQAFLDGLGAEDAVALLKVFAGQVTDPKRVTGLSAALGRISGGE